MYDLALPWPKGNHMTDKYQQATLSLVNKHQLYFMERSNMLETKTRRLF